MDAADYPTFTDVTFDGEVLRSELPVLVEFWSEQCNACREMPAIISPVATKYAGRVKVGRMNVTQASSATAMRYQIRGLPTLMLFRPGRGPLKKTTGPVEELYIQNILDGHLEYLQLRRRFRPRLQLTHPPAAAASCNGSPLTPRSTPCNRSQSLRDSGSTSPALPTPRDPQGH